MDKQGEIHYHLRCGTAHVLRLLFARELWLALREFFRAVKTSVRR